MSWLVGTVSGNHSGQRLAARLRFKGTAASRFAIVIAAGLALTSCTAGNGVDTSGLSAILSPEGQVDSAPEASETAPEAQVAAPPRPSGVPKPRPSQSGGSQPIETALVPATEGAPQQQVAEQGNAPAQAEEQEAKPLSLFARLTAPRTTPSLAPANQTAPTAQTANQAGAPSTEPESPQTAEVETKKPTGIFANLFQNRSSSTANRDTARTGVKTINSPGRARLGWNTADLPGVRSKKDLFGSDINEDLEFDQGVKLASVTNRARQGAHGLLLQRPDVKVGCFPPQLVRLLKMVERRFGRKPIVTSGYRSRSYNRLIRGARNSMHIHCKAADIQVQGVSKARLARYLRTLPGRGGVGTYCHTKSVHLDIGKKRDWNRRCRRRRARKS